MPEGRPGFVRGVMLATATFFLCFSGNAQTLPKQLQPPANEHLLLQVHAKGDQIYVCQEGVTQFTWTLKGPEAQLFDKDGKPFGKHSTGPSWQANDGSRVTGKAAGNVASPDANSIPWLLVTVLDHSGKGVLSPVTSIQRLNTTGGKAPDAGCDSVHAGREVHVPYTADYLFFVPN